MANRLLFEKDVIRVIDKHTNDDGQLDNDISCILEELYPISLQMVLDRIEEKSVQKQKRIELFENEDVVLEQRGNRYYLSLYDKEGKFQREVTIDVKDDYKVGLGNCKQRRFMRSEIKRRQFSENHQSWFSHDYACWANNHNGWRKMKKKNRRLFKKKYRREVEKDINKELNDMQ